MFNPTLQETISLNSFLKRPFILVMAVTLSLLSCTAGKEQEIATKNEQIASLNEEIEQVKANIVTIKSNKNKSISQLDQSTLDLEENYISDDILALFTDEIFQFVLEKKKIIQHFIQKELKIQELDFYTAILSTESIYNGYYELGERGITSKAGILYYLSAKIDRSPESLSKLITEEDKKFIYLFFEGNDYYYQSGLEATVKGLLQAYQEFEDDRNALSELSYALYSEEDLYEEVYEMTYEELPTGEMKEILSDENYPVDDSYASEEFRVAYPYGFWARRYHERNMEFVYDLLVEFHRNVSDDPGAYLTPEVEVEVEPEL